MNCIRNLTANSEDRGEKVGTRTEISLLTQKLDRVTLGLERIIGSARTLDLYLGCLKLKGCFASGVNVRIPVTTRAAPTFCPAIPS